MLKLMMGRLLWLLPVSSLLSLVGADCFNPNGTDRNTDPDFKPYAACVGDQNSMCCRTYDGGPDSCRSDGLCQNGDLLWRESCTDKYWDSDKCVKLCIEGSAKIYAPQNNDTVDFSTTDVMITECEDKSLCCGSSESTYAKDCCKNGKGVWLVDRQVVTTSPGASTISTASATSSTSSSSSPAQSSTTPPSTDDSDSGSNTGAIVGGVVGGVGGLAAIAGLVWFLLRRRKKANSVSEQEAFIGKSHEMQGQGQPYPPQPTNPDTIKYAHQPAPASPAELGNAERQEMSNSPVHQRPGELPA